MYIARFAAIALWAGFSAFPFVVRAQQPGTRLLRLRVEADVYQAGLHRVIDEPNGVAAAGPGRGYSVGWNLQELCMAPCEIEYPAGTYRFAVSRNVRSAVPLEELTRLDRDATLRIHFESRENLRTAGWVSWFASPVLLGGVGISGHMLLEHSSESDRNLGIAVLVVGIPIALAAAVAGLLLIELADDVLELDVLPYELCF